MMGLGNVGGLGRLGYAAANSVGWWLSGAQLDLDFANDRSFNRKTGYQASPNGLLTYTSPSPKMVYGTDGVLRYAPHNLILNSETLSAGTWTKARSTVSGSKIIAASVAGTHLVTAGGVFSADTEISIVAQAAELQNIIIQTSGGTLNPGRFYTLSGAGSIGGAYNSSGLATYSITSLGDGQYRCVFKPNETFTSINILVAQGSDISTSTNYSWTGDDVSGVLLLKAWAYRTPNHGSTYIPTTTAAVYSLPIDHDPITHAPLGVLIEEQRTNLALNSEAISGYTATAATLTADAATAPNGTTTADLLKESGTTAAHFCEGPSITISNTTVYTLSVFVKAAGRRYFNIAGKTSAFGATNYAGFDLQLGVTNGISGYTSSGIQALDNGWYRVWAVGTSADTTTVNFFVLSDGTAARAPSYAGDNTSGVYLWGAQLEAGAFATSYIPTVASQVTSAADQVTLATSAFGYNATAGTVRAEADSYNANGTTWSISDGTANERIVSNTGATYHLGVFDGGVQQASIDVGTIPTDGTPYTCAAAFAADDFGFSLDGGAVGTDTGGTLPTVTSLRLGMGASTTTAQLGGHIKRLTYFPTRKTNAELQVLSA